jgi:molybdate/tungstate transport system ATP-binding protein
MICIQNLSVRAGAFCLDSISLEISSGDYGVLMGKTGSGKTTLLECLCGLRQIEKGKIELAGTDVTEKRPAERGIGYVPQDGALFPKMTVRGHLAFPLIIRKWPRADVENRTNELAEILGISSLLDRYPSRLSGGEIQRVALGRALAFRPPLLLLDEPLSSLDDGTRQQMYDVLKSVQIKTGVTTLHVTHSRDEANHLADSLFHLQDGRIALEKPRNASPHESPSEEIVT